MLLKYSLAKLYDSFRNSLHYLSIFPHVLSDANKVAATMLFNFWLHTEKGKKWLGD